MSKNKTVALLVLVLLAVVMVFIVQVKNYTTDIDSARSEALVNWAKDNRDREMQLLSFKQHCSGDDIKKYPSIYACAEKHGSQDMLQVLSDAADGVTPPKLLSWLFG